MLINISDCLLFDDGVDLFETLRPKYGLFASNEMFTGATFSSSYSHMFSWDDNKKIIILDKEYPVISKSILFRSKGSDNRYHAIYIWINFHTHEYYIGKVNREKWKQIENYTGSGVLFRPKYKKYSQDFVRYYILICDSEKDSEEKEASIVNETLLNDPFCLNLVRGGGGVSTSPLPEERREKQRQYMKEHPERYEAMLKVAHNFDRWQIEQRNKKTKQTMSSEKYKDMTRERIKKWREEHPDEYEIAREKNRKANDKPEIKKRRVQRIKEWKEAHPEEAKAWEEKRKLAMSNPESRRKQSESLKKWNAEHKEEKKAIGRKISASKSVPILMIDANTNEVIRSFDGFHNAADWLRENGYTKSVNPASTISGVCSKKYVPGHGVRKTAFGFKWEYKNR